MQEPQAPAGRGESREAHGVVTPEIAAEAAVWIARLHGPDRSNQMERECLAWQARSPVHRVAFERCTDTWQDVAGVTLRQYATAAKIGGGAQHRPMQTRRIRWAVGVALAGAVAILLVVMQPWRASDSYAIRVGELRTVILEDGTRMSLNTATRVEVALASVQRTVSVEEGEALFEVAKDARRPFVVQVADREVVALGTVFSVRLNPTSDIGSNALDVTLIEGQVSVRAATGKSDKAPETRPVLLNPGDRLRLSERDGRATTGSQRVVMQMDRPHVDQLMAWRRNEAVFDDVPLSDAVADMNRYSRQPVVLVGDAFSKGLRISGLFRTGDNVAFARAVAALHGLVVHDRRDRVELAPGSGG